MQLCNSATLQLILGVDVGTTGTKSVLFDLAGNELYSASRPTALSHPQATWTEVDMVTVWETTAETIQEIYTKHPEYANQTVAIGVTAQGDGTWLVDADLNPVRTAISWLDGRTADLIREWQQSGISEQIFQINNTAINTSNQAGHIRWLQEHDPESLSNAVAALRCKDWIFAKLTGRISTDESDASYTYFSAQDRIYADEIFELLEITQWEHLIPMAHPSYENRWELRPVIGEKLGLRGGIPVVAGPLDVVASNLGVGSIQVGDACTILGSAGIHQIVIDQPQPEPLNVGYTICHAPSDRLLRVFPTMTGTLNLQWFVDQFYAAEQADAIAEGHNVWDTLEPLAAAIPVGCEGLMYLPYIDAAGERAPFVRPEARAQFSGLSTQHTRAHMLRAIYEGVAFSAADCYAHLSSPVESLKLAGGGAQSDLWAQIFADALDCPVSVMAGSEFGCKGAAINAGVAVGLYSSFEDAVQQTVRPGKSYLPNSQNTRLYQELVSLYRQRYEAMFLIWEARDFIYDF